MKKFILILLLPLFLGATFRGQNFVVEAPTQQFAQQVCLVAEEVRKKEAIEWLGYELPNWSKPCPVRVTITQHSGGGATSFAFDRGRLLDMSMHVEGTTDKLLKNVIPHEVTHTIFASYFQNPVPRWADEGGSVCCESLDEKIKHDQLCREVLNNNRAMPLSRLFALKEYPRDVIVLYAQGFSVSNYLINRKGKKAFIGFLTYAQSRGWDEAIRATYSLEGVNGLEKEWLQTLKDTKGQGWKLINPTFSQEEIRGTQVASQPNPSVATAPVATTNQSPDIDELLKLSRQINQKLEAIAVIKQDVEDLKKRTLKNEQDIQDLKNNRISTPSEGIIRDIPGWNQNRANPNPKPYYPQTYTQPYSATPSSSPFIQPFPYQDCPTGNCPIPAGGYPSPQFR